MTKPILSLLILLCNTTLFSQKIRVEVGPELKVPQDWTFWGHLHSDATGHYILMIDDGRAGFMDLVQSDKITPILQKYDRKFNLVYSQEIIVDEIDIRFNDMLYINGKFLFCTHQRSKNENQVNCYITKLQLDGKAGAPQNVSSWNYKEKDDAPKFFKFQISEDSSKVMVAAIADDDRADLKTKISVAVYNNDIVKIWNKGFTLPYSQKQFDLVEWSIANDGTGYVLAKVYDDNKRNESKKQARKIIPAYKMILFRFDSANEAPKEYVLELEDKFITDMTFKVTKDNNPICSGFYGNDAQKIAIGIFFSQINGASGAVTVSNKKQFSLQDIENNITQKDKSGNLGLDPLYNFKDIILRSDGGIVVVAENDFITTSTKNFRQTFHRYSIIVVSISPSGNIEWVKTIPKMQHGASNDFVGYTYWVSGTHIYFLYNDNKNNVSRPLSKKPKHFYATNSNSASVLVTISSNGQMVRQEVSNLSEDVGALIIPSNCRLIGANEFFFMTIRYQKIGKTLLYLGVIRV